MRKYVAPILCAAMMATTAVVVTGCGGDPPPAAKPPPPPPPPKAPRHKRVKVINFEMTTAGLKLPGPVVFETGSDKLKPESDEVLAVVSDYLEAKPEVAVLRIEGHTDNDGRPDANQALSEKRAMSVARWLTAQGIACGRLYPVGFGQMKPMAGTVDHQSNDDKSQNRRVAFVNAALKGKAIGGMPLDGGGRPAGDPCK